MNVHLLDGTYELFRHYYALPSHVNAQGEEIAAVRGVVGSVLALLGEGATHVAVATDHVIESFRNELWAGYKDGSGIDPPLLAQFEPLEEALQALGVTVWAMVDYEADDALAAGVELAKRDRRVERVFVCTPDKDLAQCVEGRRVVQLDRRRGRELDEAAVREKFGVGPASIPDLLALVGDAADGFPGLPGWGAKSSATVLSRYEHLESIPADEKEWDVEVRGAARLASALRASWEEALLFRRLATLVREAPVSDDVDALCWRGPGAELDEWAARLEAPDLRRRSEEIANAR